jgi:hypothetical protein
MSEFVAEFAVFLLGISLQLGIQPILNSDSGHYFSHSMWHE